MHFINIDMILALPSLSLTAASGTFVHIFLRGVSVSGHFVRLSEDLTVKKEVRMRCSLHWERKGLRKIIVQIVKDT